MNKELQMYLDFDDDCVLFNTAVLEMLGKPKHVQMMVNEQMRSVVLRCCSVEDRDAIVVQKKKVIPFAVSGRNLLGRVKSLMKWISDEPKVISGTYLPAYDAVVFELDNAENAARGKIIQE